LRETQNALHKTSGATEAGLKSEAPSLEQTVKNLDLEEVPLQRGLTGGALRSDGTGLAQTSGGLARRESGGGESGLARRGSGGGESGLARRGSGAGESGLARRGSGAGGSGLARRGSGAGESRLARRGSGGESGLARGQEYLSRVLRNQALSHTIESRIGRLTDAKTQKELEKLYGTRKRNKWESGLRKLGTLEKPSGGSHFHFTYNGRTLSVPIGHDAEFGIGLHQTLMKELLEFFEAV
jgi:hypothetical protein